MRSAGPSTGKSNPRKPAPAVLRMALLGANPQPELEALEPLPGRANYFIGQDEKRWRTGVQTYGKIRYREIYPGIDLIYYGSQGQLEFDFLVRPGADANAIRLHFEGAEGLEVDAAGALALNLDGKSVRWPKPLIYQSVHGVKKPIPGNYLLRGPEEVAFHVSDYDQSTPLIIDPVLVYASYLGGSQRDAVEAVAVDRNGNVYLAGETLSLNFPTSTAYRSISGGSNDVFVSKLNSNGTALVYSTYLGGNGNDFGQGIAIDSSGNAYVTGQTDSTNFPTRNGFQARLGGAGFPDAFLVKLGPAGSNLLYSTYFGGTNSESGNGIAVDSAGKVYLAGETASEAGFPTKKPFQAFPGGGLDAFVAKFDPSLAGASSLLYCSWLGGAEDDRGAAIAADASGNVYLTGETLSFDFSTSTFPVINALQPAYGGGGSDAFVAEVNAAGSAVLFATFLGGAGEEAGWALTLDAGSNVYLTGQTSSSDFPTTVDALQPIIGDQGNFGTMDAFVTKIHTGGTGLLYSTFLGGDIDESGTGIAVDGSGQIYVAGQTDSDDFPVTMGADQLSNGGGPEDVFVVKINPAAPGPSGLVYSTYLGKAGLDLANGVGLDGQGNFYVCGETYSTNFATTGAVQAGFGGGFSDSFVAKFSSPADLSVSLIGSPNPVLLNSNLTYTLQVNNNGATPFTGVTLAARLPASVQFLSVANNRGTCVNSSGLINCNLGVMTNNASATVVIVVKTIAAGPLTNTALLTANEPEINTDNNRPMLITDVLGVADVAVSQFDAPDPVTAGNNLVYSLILTNRGGSAATDVTLTDTLPAGVSFVGATSTQGSCARSGGMVTCSLGLMALQSEARLTITVTPISPGFITNAANVTVSGTDYNLANNSVTNVTRVNSPPTISPIADRMINEDASTGLITFTVTDLETAAGNLVVTARSSNLALVSNAGFTYGGAGTNRSLSVIPLANQFGTAIVTVSVADSDGGVGSASFLLTVKPVNDPPTLDALANLTLNEDAGLRTIALTGITSGAANENQMLSVTASNSNTGLLTNFAVNYNGPPAASGTLSFSTVTNVSGTAIITVTVKDGGASNNFVTRNFSVTVNPVNDPPTLDPISDLNLKVNAGPQIIALRGISSGAANEVQNLTVTATANKPILIPSLAVTYSSPSPTGRLVITPAADTAGSALVTVTVQDDGGTANGGQNSASRTFMVNVTVPPGLRINRNNNAVVLSWPTNVIGFGLESWNGLSRPPLWIPVAQAPAVIGGRNVVTNSLGNQRAFFRLSSVASAVPFLQISRTNNLVIVSWPTNAAGFFLQNRNGLSNASTWTPVATAPTAVGDRNVVTNSLNNGRTFFRLSSVAGGVPILRINRTNNLVVLSWPTNASGFFLESRNSLSGAAPWISVGTAPTVIGGRNVVTNSLSNGRTFFRLRSP